jgi:UDP-N-acetylglucosamine 3-dehydrogenase
VIAQIDSRKERRVFGALMEDQAICHFKFTNGVRGLIVSGYEAYLGAAIRLAGTEGAIEIVWGDPCLRVRGKDDMEWRIIDQPEGIHSFVAIDRAAEDLIQALEQPGHKPLLSADHAIQSTEVIFATYESSRWRGRIDLPLQPEDSALLSMVAEGAIGPNRM